MLEALVFLALLFVVFSIGPVTSLFGMYKHSILIAVAGCVMCWLTFTFCLVTGIAMVFNPVSLIPVLTSAFVSTVGLMMVFAGARKQQKGD